MSLSPGTRLGRYEIVAPLGAGGMGEVYRARDARLGRDAALKVLPEHFAADPERMARFEREAKLLASLNHPNIASIYGLELAGGVRFLAMELVDGDDLSRRLERGPIGAAETGAIALQIAEALEDAHEGGIVHRDLKPANVMLTSDERVKLLDFGLAKALEGDPGASDVSDLSRSPTVTNAMTGANVILGTAAYMSPEQARGRRVDKRADIWAFGCVMYEMLVGRRAFDGETVSDTLASVLKMEPDWTALPRDVPSTMSALIRRCLDKDPKRRLRDIGEARVALEKMRSGDVESGSASAAPVHAAKGIPIPVALAIAFVIATVVGILGWTLKPASQTETTWADVLPPKDNVFAIDQGGHIALSPNGSLLAFCARDSTRTTRLWIRNLASGSCHALTGTEGALYPFWSPDSRALGFFADGKLKRIDAEGGAALTLGDAPTGRGGTWSASGDILFAPDRMGRGFAVVSAAGGDVRAVLVPDSTMGSPRWPTFLPDGKRFLFCALAETTSVRAASLSGEIFAPTILRGDIGGNVSFADGLLYFVQEGALRARPFDPKRLEFIGEAVTIASSVSTLRGYGKAQVAVAPQGALAFLPGVNGIGSMLTIYDRVGRRVGTAPSTTGIEEMALSPDGHRVVLSRFDAQGGAQDLWVYDIDRELFTRLTFSEINDDPAWSADGTRIAWSHKGNIYTKSASGAGTEELLFASDEDKVPSQWSPGGRFIFYTLASDEPDQIWMLDIAAHAARPVRVSKQAWQSQAQLSRDGRWLAFVSNESGEHQVYVQDFPAMSGRWQISTDGGRAPLWKADGTELYYLDTSGRAVAVEITAHGSSFGVGASTVLFETAAESPMTSRTHIWGAAPNGDRFVVIEPQRVEGERAALTLVRHWRPKSGAPHDRR